MWTLQKIFSNQKMKQHNGLRNRVLKVTFHTANTEDRLKIVQKVVKPQRILLWNDKAGTCISSRSC